MYIYIYIMGCFVSLCCYFIIFLILRCCFFDRGAVVWVAVGCMGSGPGVPGPGNGITTPILATKNAEMRVDYHLIIIFYSNLIIKR